MKKIHKTKILLVKEHLLKHKKITPAEALELYSYRRLSDAIYKLKKAGMNIETALTSGKDKFNNPVRYATYKLIEDE